MFALVLAPRIAVVLLTGAALAASPEPAASPAGAWQVDVMAEGVLLFRPASPGPGRTNSLVVEQHGGLVVIDAQPTPEAARELLLAIAQRSPKPVRYLVLTHPHAEAAGGASAFPESTVVVGSGACRDALEDPNHDFGAELRARSADPSRWTAPPIRPPTLVLHSTAELADSRNPVQMSPLGRAHSRGDLVVVLPNAGVQHVGGLLWSDRNPWAGDADVGGWLSALNALARDSPRLVVSLHGPAVDVGTVRIERDALAWVRGQVESAFVDRAEKGRVQQRVAEAPKVGEHFDIEARPSFLPLLVDRIYEESLEGRRKRGMN